MTEEEFKEVADFARTLPVHEHEMGANWPTAAFAYVLRLLIGARLRCHSLDEAADTCRQAIDQAAAHLAADNSVMIQ